VNRAWSVAPLAWVTRVISVLFVLLNGLAWWDESQARQDPQLGGAVAGDWFWQWAVLTHLLPLAFIALATVIGWRMPIYGAIGFFAFAAAQALSVGTEWVYLPLVAAPPLLAAVLYFIGWILARKTSAQKTT